MTEALEPNIVPEWADENTSKQLPVLRRKGEGQRLEYMREFPGQVRELAKEIAAFATSGGGLILIGVDDGGNLAGLTQTDTISERDELIRRIEGLANGTVSPSTTPKAGFAREGRNTVLFIRVHKGNQPVYYCNGKPYLRHLTESRPAKPEEVIARVLSWAGVAQTSEGIQVDESSEFHWKKHLDTILVDLLIVMDEMPRLKLNPGPDHLESTCEHSAQQLRNLVIEYLQDEEALAESLDGLADDCDQIVATLSSRHSGMWDLLERGCPPVRKRAADLRRNLIGDSVAGDLLLAEAARSITVAPRKLRRLLERFDQMIGCHRQDDVLAEAGGVGEELLPLTYSRLGFLSDDDMNRLREAAMDIHLLLNHEQWYDTYGSENQLKDRITEQTKVIETVASKID